MQGIPRSIPVTKALQARLEKHAARFKEPDNRHPVALAQVGRPTVPANVPSESAKGESLNAIVARANRRVMGR